MRVFLILIPVTLLVIAGYFIQFSAQWAEGGLKTFGRYLSLWVFVLAALLVIGAATAPMMGFGGPGMMRGIGPGFMMRRGFSPEDRSQLRGPPPPGEAGISPAPQAQPAP